LDLALPRAFCPVGRDQHILTGQRVETTVGVINRVEHHHSSLPDEMDGVATNGAWKRGRAALCMLTPRTPVDFWIASANCRRTWLRDPGWRASSARVLLCSGRPSTRRCRLGAGV